MLGCVMFCKIYENVFEVIINWVAVGFGQIKKSERGIFREINFIEKARTKPDDKSSLKYLNFPSEQFPANMQTRAMRKRNILQNENPQLDSTHKHVKNLFPLPFPQKK
jgi:hypothetical protein